MEEFHKTIDNEEKIKKKVQSNIKKLIIKLESNEEMIKELMGK
jgi:hypothetical protein